MDYRVLALFVLAAVAWYALFLYHKRRGVELDKRHAAHHGWEKFTLSVRQDVWECPHCGALFRTFAAVQTHRFATSSACAAHQETLAAEELTATLERAGKDAQTAGRWSVSATVGGEEFRGAVDSLTDKPPRGELESGAGNESG